MSMGQELEVHGTALQFGVRDERGNPVEISTRFVVSDTAKFILSVGELARRGWTTTLVTLRTLAHAAGISIPLTRQGNTFYLAARQGWQGTSPWEIIAAVP